MIAVRPLLPAEELPLLEFARTYYGVDSHQANPTRLEWLTRHNPHGKTAEKDILVAVEEGGRIVGCHWKTRIAWNWEGTQTVIPSLHDLAILPEYRQGHGLGLVLAALAGEQKAGLLGLSSTSEGIYQRMRCPPVPMHRLRKILSYTRTALGMCGIRRTLPEAAGWESVVDGLPFSLTRAPDDQDLARALQIPYSGRCHLAWTPASYRWRFFHRLGPRHYLLLADSARAVFSVGWRRGAVLSRLVDAAVADPAMYAPLFRAVEGAMRRLGVAVATVATTSEPALLRLAASGWKPQPGVSARFFLRGPAAPEFQDIWGASYDYGFDASGSAPID